MNQKCLYYIYIYIHIFSLLVLLDIMYMKGYGECEALWSASGHPQHVELHSYDKAGKQGYYQGDVAKHTPTPRKAILRFVEAEDECVQNTGVRPSFTFGVQAQPRHSPGQTVDVRKLPSASISLSTCEIFVEPFEDVAPVPLGRRIANTVGVMEHDMTNSSENQHKH